MNRESLQAWLDKYVSEVVIGICLFHCHYLFNTAPPG
jgi:hypothetical protein